ncbi:MAG TPA: T9SS type B sorting domain-containing protein, partial [Phnomibacter sp.]|nr:T9SS type B sorting domain-containing protein [Phnomibacter sp.]
RDTDHRITITTEGGCVTVDSLLVQIIERADIKVPTAFTPNGDGLNDVLRPILMGLTDLKFFRVYNRYGELLFETNNAKEGWNGTYKGREQLPQAYVWAAEGIDADGNVVVKKGTSVLIR